MKRRARVPVYSQAVARRQQLNGSALTCFAGRPQCNIMLLNGLRVIQ
jgi:hypothetical protein